MKVIAINGSPNKNGNTAYALKTVGAALQKEGIEFEILEVGGKRIRGCIGCDQCSEQQNMQCQFTDDVVNESVAKMVAADGIVIGSPVYYSGIAGTMKSFLDRSFYVAAANGAQFRHKVGASVVAVRRTGGSATFNGLNHYLNVSEMLVPSSNYWNVIHGLEPGDAAQDAEGVQIMQTLGENMAWLLKMREAGKKTEPAGVEKIYTNFIR
ncbi:FMN reductase [Bacteroidia bacterium]|nr:FMN reductase [Bacteroidia bacterium]